MRSRSCDDPLGPEGSQLVRPERELGRQDLVGVLAEPRARGVSGPSATSANFTGSPGISTGWSTPSVRGCSTSMWRPARCGSDTTSASVATGPATRPAALSASEASRLVLVAGPRLDGGADVALQMVQPALRCGEARVVGPLGAPDRPGQVRPLVRPQHLQHEPAVGGPEAVQDAGPRRAHGHAHGPEVGHHVEHGHHRVEHGEVDALGRARSGRAGAARRASR